MILDQCRKVVTRDLGGGGWTFLELSVMKLNVDEA